MKELCEIETDSVYKCLTVRQCYILQVAVAISLFTTTVEVISYFIGETKWS